MFNLFENLFVLPEWHFFDTDFFAQLPPPPQPESSVNATDESETMSAEKQYQPESQSNANMHSQVRYSDAPFIHPFWEPG